MFQDYFYNVSMFIIGLWFFVLSCLFLFFPEVVYVFLGWEVQDATQFTFIAATHGAMNLFLFVLAVLSLFINSLRENAIAAMLILLVLQVGCFVFISLIEGIPSLISCFIVMMHLGFIGILIRNLIEAKGKAT